MPPGTEAQEQAFKEISDQRKIVRWEQLPNGNIHLWCDEGYEAIIDPEGEWKWMP
jgi:hypothetical protein